MHETVKMAVNVLAIIYEKLVSTIVSCFVDIFKKMFI